MKTKPAVQDSTPSEAHKAFTLVPCAGGWQCITYTIENGQIIDVHKSNPDFKAIAIERLKIDLVTALEL